MEEPGSLLTTGSHRVRLVVSLQLLITSGFALSSLTVIKVMRFPSSLGARSAREQWERGSPTGAGTQELRVTVGLVPHLEW